MRAATSPVRSARSSPRTDWACGPKHRRDRNRAGGESTSLVRCPIDRVERFRPVFHRMSEPNRRSWERSWGGSPVPRLWSPRDVGSPHSGNPPREQGEEYVPESWGYRHPSLSRSRWSVSYNYCLRSDGSVSIVEWAAPRVSLPCAELSRLLVRGVPRKESVHNRFAGRPEPMAWRPSGETRLMGWTGNHDRRNGRRRHRPLLENLDDRCLLSTSAGIRLTDHLAAHAIVRRQATVRHAHDDALAAAESRSYDGASRCEAT